MVERNLAKVEVAGPSPVFRSMKVIGNGGLFSCVSVYAEDTSVYINELGGFVKTEMPFQTVLGFCCPIPRFVKFIGYGNGLLMALYVGPA